MDFEEYSKRHADGMGVSDCVGYDYGNAWRQGHARALKEMGAELLTSRMFYEHLATNEASKAQVLSEQLAAAQSEIERLSGNCEVKDKNKKRLERMYGELEQQLAAAELRAAEYEKALLKASLDLRTDIKGIETSLEDAWDSTAKMLDNVEHYLLSLGATEDEIRTVLAAHTRPTKEAADE